MVTWQSTVDVPVVFQLTKFWKLTVVQRAISQKKNDLGPTLHPLTHVILSVLEEKVEMQTQKKKKK